MKKTQRILAAVLALILLLALMPLVRAQTAEDFHAPYLCGYPDGSIRAETALTREALAQVLYRMMDAAYLEQLGLCEGCFPDVPPERWSYAAVSTMAALGILMADADGSFYPEQGVTGQMLALTLARIADTRAGREAMSALACGWKEQKITFEADNGWVMGLYDGVFAPDEPLTRGQFAAIMNRILGRTPGSLDDLMVGMPLFCDNVDTQNRYFLDLQEAAVGHSFRIIGEREVWTGLG